MTYVDPKNIPGAVTPTGGFICQKCRQAKQPTTQRTAPPKTVQMSIDELTQKKIVVQPNHYFFKYYM